MHGLAEVITVLTTFTESSPEYVKSKHIAAKTSLTPHEAAPRLCHVRNAEDVPVSVEHWSGTGASATYRVTVEDAGLLREYLAHIADAPGEPTLQIERTGTVAASE